MTYIRKKEKALLKHISRFLYNIIVLEKTILADVD